MNIVIELTEGEIEEVGGGAGSASFAFNARASGTTATVSGTLTIATTASSACISGTFSSFSS